MMSAAKDLLIINLHLKVGVLWLKISTDRFTMSGCDGLGR
jgi:hypothetical protein